MRYFIFLFGCVTFSKCGVNFTLPSRSPVAPAAAILDSMTRLHSVCPPCVSDFLSLSLTPLQPHWAALLFLGYVRGTFSPQGFCICCSFRLERLSYRCGSRVHILRPSLKCHQLSVSKHHRLGGFNIRNLHI